MKMSTRLCVAVLVAVLLALGLQSLEFASNVESAYYMSIGGSGR